MKNEPRKGYDIQAYLVRYGGFENTTEALESVGVPKSF
jgi:hypothetical protein